MSLHGDLFSQAVEKFSQDEWFWCDGRGWPLPRSCSTITALGDQVSGGCLRTAQSSVKLRPNLEDQLVWTCRAASCSVAKDASREVWWPTNALRLTIMLANGKLDGVGISIGSSLRVHDDIPDAPRRTSRQIGSTAGVKTKATGELGESARRVSMF